MLSLETLIDLDRQRKKIDWILCDWILGFVYLGHVSSKIIVIANINHSPQHCTK